MNKELKKKELEKRLNQLKQTISKAFANVPYPGDDNIYAGNIDHDIDYHSDFIGKHWSEISSEFLIPRHFHSTLSFTAEAYWFFLPAYMLVVAEFYNEADVIGDYTIKELLPPGKGHGPGCRNLLDKHEFETRVKLLTDGQKKAVVEFLEYIKDYHNYCCPYSPWEVPDAALEFWRQF